MINTLTTRIRQLFINKPFLTLYPISEKPDNEQKALVEAFNQCDSSENTDTTILLSSLYEYARAKLSLSKAELESIERNLSQSYKTKKIRKKNKDTGEVEINKVTSEKSGAKNTIERFQNLKEENMKRTEKYEYLIKAIENGTLSVQDLPVLDELLEDNKYKRWVYSVLLTIAILIPILIFLLAKIFYI